MNKIKYRYLDSPVGELLLIGEKKLERIEFQTSKVTPGKDWIEDADVFKGVVDQLKAYFKRERSRFDVEMDLKGTEFQKRVWAKLVQIPYGTTISYGELAKRIGNPKASRAVGMANGKNPIPIIIPCHRVIGKNGTLTGFGGGLDIKQTLLDLESNLLF